MRGALPFLRRWFERSWKVRQSFRCCAFERFFGAKPPREDDEELRARILA